MGWETTRKSTVNYFFEDYDKGLYETSEEHPAKAKSPLNILYFDLETSPELGWVWGRWKQNLGDVQIERYSHLLSASWAFNDGEVQSVRLTPEDVKNEDDLTVVVDMVKAINNADIIVGFNSKKFDIKVLKTRMIKWNLPPMKPVKHLDIMQIAKAQMRFPSNSMDNISKYLGYSELKIATGGFDLWKRCMNYRDVEECDKALKEMELYNKGDIEVTRNLFKKFQGWSTGVNVGTMVNNLSPHNATLRCTKCGSDDIFLEDGFAYTASSGFNLYRCGNTECRGVSRISSSGKNLLGVV